MRALLQADVPFDVQETELDLPIRLDEDVVYTLRPITAEQARTLTKRHTQASPNRQTHQMEDVTDWVAVNQTFLDYTLTAWVGILDGGQIAPCDLAHKLTLPVVIQAALIARAQVGEGAGQRAASFRQLATVL